MANVQAGDTGSAQRQLAEMFHQISEESRGRFSLLKLRTLQVLTNANRAAFSSGAPTGALGRHGAQILQAIDRIQDAGQLLRFAHRAVGKTVRLVPKSGGYGVRKVEEAIAYIKAHYAEPIPRRHLAARLRCSPAHFSRLFSKTTGLPCQDFIVNYRLERARDLLRRSHLAIGEIASAVGYRDPYQFSRMFRRRLGVSPRQFRNSRAGGADGGRATASQEKAPNSIFILPGR